MTPRATRPIRPAAPAREHSTRMMVGLRATPTETVRGPHVQA